MIYFQPKLRLNLHWGQCCLSLGGGLLIFTYLLVLLKCFQIKLLLSQERDYELVDFARYLITL
uniref:Uncharacterized protein n=1 Tax=Brassica oleracea var. oleracea TaxID=109376 RepID=A0A0D3E757_BRAOL